MGESLLNQNEKIKTWAYHWNRSGYIGSFLSSPKTVKYFFVVSGYVSRSLQMLFVFLFMGKPLCELERLAKETGFLHDWHAWGMQSQKSDRKMMKTHQGSGQIRGNGPPPEKSSRVSRERVRVCVRARPVRSIYFFQRNVGRSDQKAKFARKIKKLGHSFFTFYLSIPY